LISLVFLLLLSLLALHSLQDASLQERMAGSMIDRNVALQRAEVALLEGESWCHQLKLGYDTIGNGAAPIRMPVGDQVPDPIKEPWINSGWNNIRNVGSFKRTDGVYTIRRPFPNQPGLCQVTAIGFGREGSDPTKNNTRVVLRSTYRAFVHYW
jgi:Tfp pilus assembly protein PilX